MQPIHAAILGIIEGLTEYLPVSSTGHLILASAWLGLQGEAVNAFEIVIQSGAILAVLGLYRAQVARILRGMLGQDAAGRRLGLNLLVSFAPAVVAGLALHRQVKTLLFSPWPVAAALALGGAAILVLDGPLRRKTAASPMTLETLRVQDALLIGIVQCLALWPGTSRAMVTLLAGMCVGLPAPAAAEYSFLLALPMLGAATAFDALKSGRVLLHDVGAASLAIGLAVSAIVAALAVAGFVRYLSRRGLAVFGWYRIVLAGAVWWVMR